jgi:hypothetical protein
MDTVFHSSFKTNFRAAFLPTIPLWTCLIGLGRGINLVHDIGLDRRSRSPERVKIYKSRVFIIYCKLWTRDRKPTITSCADSKAP